MAAEIVRESIDAEDLMGQILRELLI